MDSSTTMHFHLASVAMISWLMILTSIFTSRSLAFTFGPTRRTFSRIALSEPLKMTDYKRMKFDETPSDKVIGTHSGSFQADEAMGVWMLRQVSDYRNSKVVRSRDLKVLDTLDIVIDVGGVYDHSKLRYDHHQRGYDERFDEGREGSDGRCTKLSASGLVYRHYGKDVIRAYYPSLLEEHLEISYKKIYNSLLE
jgi:hypothetical protein